MEEFDLITIGAGSAGVRASRLAAQSGAKVALCEEDRIGGTCVLRGCIPKKLLVYAANYAKDFKDAAGFGWQLPSPAQFSWSTLQQRQQQELSRLSGLYQQTLEKNTVQLLYGHARLKDKNTVEIEGVCYKAKRILLAAGGHPYKPAIPGIEHSINSNEAFLLPQLPSHLVIVGGGYIAVEFAHVFAAFGVQVTQIIRAPQVLRGFDGDLRQRLQQALQEQGVNILNETQITSITKDATGLLHLQLDNAQSLSCDTLLYATGRRPATQNLGLSEIGVKLDKKGSVSVDQNYQSSVENIFAIGDITDRLCLTPVAIAEAEFLIAKIFRGERAPAIDYSLVTTAVFSHPEIATVGMSEEEAFLKYPLSVYESDFRPLRHSLSGRNERSYLKVICEKASEKVLGIHMIGNDAAEIMQGLAVAMQCGVNKQQLDATVALHPTAAEEFVTLKNSRPGGFSS